MPDDKSPKATPAMNSNTSSTVTEESKLLSAVGYIIAVLVPLYVLLTDKKNDKFAKFHAYQSLLLTVVLFVVDIVLGIVLTVLAFVSSGVGFLLSCIYLPFGLIVLILVLFCAYKAFNGEKYMLPVIGPMADKYAK